MDEDQLNSVREAVRSATTTVAAIYTSQGVAIGDLLLEEVEKVGDQWHVTLSFTRPPANPAIATLVGMGPRRAFKRVKIDARTGEFLGMEIRELQTNQTTTE